MIAAEGERKALAAPIGIGSFDHFSPGVACDRGGRVAAIVGDNQHPHGRRQHGFERSDDRGDPASFVMRGNDERDIAGFKRRSGIAPAAGRKPRRHFDREHRADQRHGSKDGPAENAEEQGNRHHRDQASHSARGG